MKKSILNLGKALSKVELKSINGSVAGACRGLGNNGQACQTHSDCTRPAPAAPVCFRGCCNYYV